jgi:hypothetical protein
MATLGFIGRLRDLLALVGRLVYYLVKLILWLLRRLLPGQ